jgi:succinate-semialdehyde dehydrogenase/glutarate-semialdehyde dehydrogenase
LRAREVLAKVPTGLYIAGAWRALSDERTFAVDDPATGETIAEIADAVS